MWMFERYVRSAAENDGRYEAFCRNRKEEITMKRINAKPYVLRLLFASGTGAGLTRRASVLAIVAMAAMPQITHAQTTVPTTFKVLDDFTKGADTINIKSGNETKSYTDTGALADDHIIGGTRAFELTVGVAGNNPYGQRVGVEVLPDPGNSLPSSFVWSVGYGVIGPRIDLQYGSGASPLKLNLSGYDRIRVMFSGLVGSLGFDVVAFQGSNLEAGSCSLGILPFPGPFAVDFPLNAFTLGSGGVDFSDTALFDFILQNQGLGFGADLAITGIYAIPKGVVTNGTAGTPGGPALYTCAKP
jgi:hypothetical protein